MTRNMTREKFTARVRAATDDDLPAPGQMKRALSEQQQAMVDRSTDTTGARASLAQQPIRPMHFRQAKAITPDAECITSTGADSAAPQGTLVHRNPGVTQRGMIRLPFSTETDFGGPE
jgi:hypothetical protein